MLSSWIPWSPRYHCCSFWRWKRKLWRQELAHRVLLLSSWGRGLDLVWFPRLIAAFRSFSGLFDCWSCLWQAHSFSMLSSILASIYRPIFSPSAVDLTFLDFDFLATFITLDFVRSFSWFAWFGWKPTPLLEWLVLFVVITDFAAIEFSVLPFLGPYDLQAVGYSNVVCDSVSSGILGSCCQLMHPMGWASSSWGVWYTASTGELHAFSWPLTFLFKWELWYYLQIEFYFKK